MAKILKIAQSGEPCLRAATGLVIAQDAGIQELIDDMLETSKDALGLAAPQVFKSLRLFIVASQPHPSYPEAPLIEPTAILNPVIHSTSLETETNWEGCLSIPGIRVKVRRAKSILFSYTDRHGVVHMNVTYSGLPARIFQHEHDHIEGILITDKANPEDVISEEEYQYMVKNN